MERILIKYRKKYTAQRQGNAVPTSEMAVLYCAVFLRSSSSLVAQASNKWANGVVLPQNHTTLKLCWFHANPASATLAQHEANTH